MKKPRPPSIFPPTSTAPRYDAVFDAMGGRNLAAVARAFKAAPRTYNPNPDLAYGLQKAATEGEPGLAQLLLEWGANPDPTDGGPLFTAARRGHASVVGVLLNHGAWVNRYVTGRRWQFEPETGQQVCVLGWTALLFAAWAGHANVARLLLKRGAYVNAPGEDGSTPLAWAIRKERSDLVTLLRDAGGVERNNVIPVRDEEAILEWNLLRKQLAAESDTNPLLPLVDAIARDPRLNNFYPYRRLDYIRWKSTHNDSEPSSGVPYVAPFGQNRYRVYHLRSPEGAPGLEAPLSEIEAYLEIVEETDYMDIISEGDIEQTLAVMAASVPPLPFSGE